MIVFALIFQKLVDNALAELGLGNNEAYGRITSISIIVYNLIKELPADIVSSKAMDIISMIERCNDYTLDQVLIIWHKICMTLFAICNLQFWLQYHLIASFITFGCSG